MTYQQAWCLGLVCFGWYRLLILYSDWHTLGSVPLRGPLCSFVSWIVLRCSSQNILLGTGGCLFFVSQSNPGSAVNDVESTGHTSKDCSSRAVRGLSSYLQLATTKEVLAKQAETMYLLT